MAKRITGCLLKSHVLESARRWSARSGRLHNLTHTTPDQLSHPQISVQFAGFLLSPLVPLSM